MSGRPRRAPPNVKPTPLQMVAQAERFIVRRNQMAPSHPTRRHRGARALAGAARHPDGHWHRSGGVEFGVGLDAPGCVREDATHPVGVQVPGMPTGDEGTVSDTEPDEMEERFRGVGCLE